MTRVVLRGLLARRLRLTLTAFAVALGVTLVAGTYVFTDTINSTFDTIFTKAYDKTDVVVSPGDEVTNQDGEKPPLPASVLTKVRATDGIANAEGSAAHAGGWSGSLPLRRQSPMNSRFPSLTCGRVARTSGLTISTVTPLSTWPTSSGGTVALR